MEYWTLKEVAKALRVTPRTIHTYLRAKENKMPSYKLCGKLIFREEEIKTWLERFKSY